MNIVFLTHPEFSNIRSISLYTEMLAKGMQERNHTVQIFYPKPYFNKISISRGAKKWLGYIDQYIIFKISFQQKMKRFPKNTLFVVCDQALGMWVPNISNRPHVVHCHDFLAQRSALGEISENPVKRLGQLYQNLIRRGYSKANNFISISHKTKNDLHRFLPKTPKFSEVVYNGLNQEFNPGNIDEVRNELSENFKIKLHDGYILHVGGNQFYKNRAGVLKIYGKWRELQEKKLPLLMVGPQCTIELKMIAKSLEFFSDVHFLTEVSNSYLQKLYQGATVLLFPSLEEGFGWPIAEAMACGCPVITTKNKPMTEVGGDACFYIPRQPNVVDISNWENQSAKILDHVISLNEKERKQVIASGLENAKRFNTQEALNKIEVIYKNILADFQLQD